VRWSGCGARGRICRPPLAIEITTVICDFFDQAPGSALGAGHSAACASLALFYLSAILHKARHYGLTVVPRVLNQVRGPPNWSWMP
jgi:hypothetical protein